MINEDNFGNKYKQKENRVKFLMEEMEEIIL